MKGLHKVLGSRCKQWKQTLEKENLFLTGEPRNITQTAICALKDEKSFKKQKKGAIRISCREVRKTTIDIKRKKSLTQLFLFQIKYSGRTDLKPHLLDRNLQSYC